MCFVGCLLHAYTLVTWPIAIEEAQGVAEPVLPIVFNVFVLMEWLLWDPQQNFIPFDMAACFHSVQIGCC